MMLRMGIIAFLVMLMSLTDVGTADATIVGTLDLPLLQSSVVKITAKSQDGSRLGTGFIVQLDKDSAYILTAAHVIAGDAHPLVAFFTKQYVQISAKVINIEGEEDTSLALLLVQGKDNIPAGLTVLPLATGGLSEGDEFLIIGHPRPVGDWATLGGKAAKRRGRTLVIDANIDEGNSGGAND